MMCSFSDIVRCRYFLSISPLVSCVLCIPLMTIGTLEPTRVPTPVSSLRTLPYCTAVRLYSPPRSRDELSSRDTTSARPGWCAELRAQRDGTLSLSLRLTSTVSVPRGSDRQGTGTTSRLQCLGCVMCGQHTELHGAHVAVLLNKSRTPGRVSLTLTQWSVQYRCADRCARFSLSHKQRNHDIQYLRHLMISTALWANPTPNPHPKSNPNGHPNGNPNQVRSGAPSSGPWARRRRPSRRAGTPRATCAWAACLASMRGTASSTRCGCGTWRATPTR